MKEEGRRKKKKVKEGDGVDDCSWVGCYVVTVGGTVLVIKYMIFMPMVGEL